jgi:hypothetical protein
LAETSSNIGFALALPDPVGAPPGLGPQAQRRINIAVQAINCLIAISVVAF